MTRYSEDTLVQQTTAEYFQRQLGWESVYAYNNEDFGPDSLLGRNGCCCKTRCAPTSNATTKISWPSTTGKRTE